MRIGARSNLPKLSERRTSLLRLGYDRKAELPGLPLLPLLSTAKDRAEELASLLTHRMAGYARHMAGGR
jgi:hypothetical protein